jgi:hypothetical protein
MNSRGNDRQRAGIPRIKGWCLGCLGRCRDAGNLAGGVLGIRVSRRSHRPAFIPPSHPRSADRCLTRGEEDRRPRASRLGDGRALGPETSESMGVGRGPSWAVSMEDPGYRGRLRLRSARGRPWSGGSSRSRRPGRARRWRPGLPFSSRIAGRSPGLLMRCRKLCAPVVFVSRKPTYFLPFPFSQRS